LHEINVLKVEIGWWEDTAVRCSWYCWILEFTSLTQTGTIFYDLLIASKIASASIYFQVTFQPAFLSRFLLLS
jgi:hypothetical protein